MFDYDDEYKKATESAMVNSCNETNGFNWKVLLFNMIGLSALIGIVYFTFNYLKEETHFFHKTNVMGVSYTMSNEEYEQHLNSLYDQEINNDKTNMNDVLSYIVNTSTTKDNSEYTQAISQEINKKHQQHGSRTIVVKAGDTLASLSKKYYGNSMAFNKIIENNRELSSGSDTIYIGQKLNLPY